MLPQTSSRTLELEPFWTSIAVTSLKLYFSVSVLTMSAVPVGSTTDGILRLLWWILVKLCSQTPIILGTKVQGWQQRELNDVWVSAQLWIVTSINSSGEYSIQNANSRTYLTLTDGMWLIIGLFAYTSQHLYGLTFAGSSADNTPIVGFHGTGNTNQQWIITRTNDGTAYV